MAISATREIRRMARPRQPFTARLSDRGPPRGRQRMDRFSSGEADLDDVVMTVVFTTCTTAKALSAMALNSAMSSCQVVCKTADVIFSVRVDGLSQDMGNGASPLAVHESRLGDFVTVTVSRTHPRP